MKQNQKRACLNLVLFSIPYVVVVGLFQLIGVHISGVEFTDVNFKQTSEQSVIIAFFGLVGTFLVVLFFMKLIDKKPFLNLGFQFQNHKKDIIIGIIVGLIIMALGFWVLVFFNQIKFAMTFFSIYEISLTLILFLLAALTEELLFRGYVLGNLMNSFNKIIALIISAILFSLMHAANPNIDLISYLNLFLAGIVLGLPYIYTRNLMFPIALHFSWNFFQSLFGFNVSGRHSYSLIELDIIENSILNGGEFGFEGSILSVLFQVILILIIFSFFERKAKRNKIVF